MKAAEHLDEKLQEFDAYLIRGDSSDTDLFYLTEFEADDPVIYLRKKNEDIILTSSLEIERAKQESTVDKVVKTSEYKNKSDEEANSFIDILDVFLTKENVEDLAVPQDFPLYVADSLREIGYQISPIKEGLTEERKIKSPKEIQKLKSAQKSTEKAMEKVRDIIEEAFVKENGELALDKETLTSEKIKSEVKKLLMEEGCEVPKEPIVASGKDASQPHNRGSGPIKEGEPIVVDIFPRKKHYYGDMTRTFVKGQTPQKLKEMHEAVLEAQKAAFKILKQNNEPQAKEIHNKASQVLEKEGFDTLNQDEDNEQGFIHSTGHAVGLELHEKPGLSDNEDIIKEGMVLTIEPGLYYSDIGGVRLEDMVRVTEESYENFNSMKKDL